MCVGVVERDRLIDGKAITADDVVIGVGSSGLHSNGYSLVRKVVFDIAGLSVDDTVEELQQTVGELLLTPTQIYARAVRTVLNHYKVKSVVHGIAHITGGGLAENLERILPGDVDVNIERGSWSRPPVFDWIQRLGEIEEPEMDRVFNNGLGLVLIVSDYFADKICRMLQGMGYDTSIIGRTSEGSGQVHVD